MKRDVAKVRPPAASSTAQSIGTILIVIHFFCVLLAFSGNVLRSTLQDRLIGILRPYLQLLNFDPDFAAFHLTRGTIEDVDHRWEVLPVGASASDPNAWQPVPANTSPWGETSKHWQRMSKLAAMQMMHENETAAAELARGAARYAYHELHIKPQQIRCRRVHEIQTWDSDGGPREFPYIADVLIDDRGHVEVAKIGAKSETALPENTPGDAAP